MKKEAYANTVQNAQDEFVCQVLRLKKLKGWTNKDLAEHLGGINVRTAENLTMKPFSARGRNILMIQQWLREEERKRNEG